MVFRCSSLVAGLALLGICAPLTTSVRAGDRIEFSSPLVPLAIPQPEVDTRQQEPVKLFRGPPSSGDMMSGGFIPSGQVTFMRTRKVEKDPWNKDPWDKDQWNTDPFKDKEDMFSGMPQGQNPENAASNMLTILGVQRDLDSQPQEGILLHRDGDSQNDQNGQNGQDNSRFDQANTSSDQPDRGGLFGRDSSQDSGMSSFFGSLTRGPASASRFNAGSFVTGDHQAASLTGDTTAPAWQFGQGPQADDPNRFALPADFASFRPTDPQAGADSSGAASSYLHAWDDEAAAHPAATESPARNRFLSEQINAARVVAPNRPANLPWVKRPGDPF